MAKCIICGNENACEESGSIYNLSCPDCGKYKVSHRLLKWLENNNGILNINDNERRILRQFFKNNKAKTDDANDNTNDNIINFDSEGIIESIINSPLIPNTIGEKVKIIMQYIADKCSLGGYNEISENDLIDIAYLKNSNELDEILEELNYNNYIEFNPTFDTVKSIKLKLYGLKYAEELKKELSTSNKVFVAMGFNKDLLEAQEVAIKPACDDCGFKAYLINEVEHNEGITDKIIAEIKESRFVIVDFTYNNCGAYFEAGYAQGRGLEVIRTCKKEWYDEKDENGKKINFLHFDVTHYNFILWQNHKDLKEKLINRIRATIL
jgi:nucleoside 2-deoxyribosyltransferase